MKVRINSEWQELLGAEFEKPYFQELVNFVRHEYATQRVFPEGRNIFRALDLCPPSKVKVVIIGQDPYHGEGQANGLCFSVNDGIQFPPSLRNIFKEIESDLGTPAPTSGNLDRWAEQGVLLLNATLTVRAHQAASHAGHGWEQFTDAVIASLTRSRKGIVYMLWGNYAARKGALVSTEDNLVLRSAHPSPLSAYNGFFGSRHFSKANAYLQSKGLDPIIW